MKRYTLIFFVGLMAAILIGACQSGNEKEYETRWAGETLEEIIGSLENQFGGFDQTMIETNYRYNELYWAGVDENWGYAEYQLDEMLGSLEKGFIRRPAREASAAQFVNQVSPRLLEAIEAGDRGRFLETFNQFAVSCNTCHEMEEVAFIQVAIPEVRTSVIQF